MWKPIAHEFLCRFRPSKTIALQYIAAASLCKSRLPWGLNSLHHDELAECPPDADQRLEEGRALALVVHGLYESTIDLQYVHRQPLQDGK